MYVFDGMIQLTELIYTVWTGWGWSGPLSSVTQACSCEGKMCNLRLAGKCLLETARCSQVIGCKVGITPKTEKVFVFRVKVVPHHYNQHMPKAATFTLKASILTLFRLSLPRTVVMKLRPVGIFHANCR